MARVATTAVCPAAMETTSSTTSPRWSVWPVTRKTASYPSPIRFLCLIVTVASLNSCTLAGSASKSKPKVAVSLSTIVYTTRLLIAW